MKDEEMTTDYSCQDCGNEWRGMMPIGWVDEEGTARTTGELGRCSCGSWNVIQDPRAWTWIPKS